MRFLKWLYPGMQIKRWLVLCIAGVLSFGIGAALLPIDRNILQRALALSFLLTGLCGVIVGGVFIMRSLLDVVSPQENQDLVEKVFQRRHLDKGPRIVTIGGGTGLSNLLQGLKQYTTNITAVVTVADDGGSSGRLRQEFDILPPGDIRNCLVALADTEPLMQQLFQYRFDGGSALDGHSFGNLFITAMTKITGDFEQAVKASSKVLAIRGNVAPSTNTKVRLVGEHADGSRTYGETNISESGVPIRRIFLEPAGCKPTNEALKAIRNAHAIVLGPGSLYTSIIPNLLVEGMVDAIMASKAVKIYVCNVMTQYKETTGYSASQHIRALIDHSRPGIVDAALVNNEPIPQEVMNRYSVQGAGAVEADLDAVRALGCDVVADNFCLVGGGPVRHNAERVSKQIIQLIIGSRGWF